MPDHHIERGSAARLSRVDGKLKVGRNATIQASEGNTVVVTESARITRMSYGVGVPVDRLKSILQSLISFGLVQTIKDEEQGENSIFYTLTPRAFEFLETYWKMQSFLETFGRSVSSDF